MSIFSLVVARKNSKGLKGKVTQLINSKYVFEYSVEYSLALPKNLNSEVVTAISSDSEIIEKYCMEKHILFIRRRPKLALDVTKIEDVIYDAYARVGKKFKYISLLYGNIPTRYPDEFLKAFNFLEENPGYDAVLSMHNVQKYNPAWMFELDEDILPVKKEQGYRRQDLKQLMIHDGHTILTRAGYFVDFMEKGKSSNLMYERFGKKIKPILNTKLVIDIDTEMDLKLAQNYFR